MPKSALPPEMAETAAGTGTDWDFWPMKYIKRSWLAYGPRATEWWAKWREMPVALFARKNGAGLWRFESTDGRQNISSPRMSIDDRFYLSAIQYWCRWHLAILWPLHVQMHIYRHSRDIPIWPQVPGSSIDGKLFYLRLGFRRDADRVYWGPSFFLGLTWN